MYNTINKKTKVTLSDYDFMKEIQSRIFLSKLTPEEAAIFSHIQLLSLKFRVQELLEEFPDGLQEALNKLQSIGLLEVKGCEVFVNKEMRKYFEMDAMKLQEGFEVNIDYIHKLLSRLPQNLLPLWYQIPKSSENIFNSILEKNFLTPSHYETYLKELEFEDPLLQELNDFIHKSPCSSVTAEEICKKWNLGRQDFHAYILQLEFHFSAFLSYEIKNDKLVEVVTTFKEWQKWIRYLEESKPDSIEECDKITRVYESDFGAIEAMNELLKSGHGDERLADYLVELKLASVKDGKLTTLPLAKEWLSLKIKDQANALYRFVTSNGQSKEIRQVEKGLQRVLKAGWVLMEDFEQSLHAPIEETPGVMLVKAGHRYSYQIPKYTKSNLECLRSIIQGPLHDAGIVSIGTYLGKPAFCVSPFGRANLE